MLDHAYLIEEPSREQPAAVGFRRCGVAVAVDPRMAQAALGEANKAFPSSVAIRHLKRVMPCTRAVAASVPASGGASSSSSSSSPVAAELDVAAAASLGLGGAAPSPGLTEHATQKRVLILLGSFTVNGDDGTAAWEGAGPDFAAANLAASAPTTAAAVSTLGGVFEVTLPTIAPQTAAQWDASNSVWPQGLPRPPAVPLDHHSRWSAPTVAAVQRGALAAKEAAAASSARGCLGIGAAIVDQAGHVVAASGCGITASDSVGRRPYTGVALVERTASATAGDDGTNACALPTGAHAVFEALRAASVVRRGSGDKDPSAYLCTGLTVVTTAEPCAMCCMAMVHSRVARAVFGSRNPGHGGLVSAYRIHTLPSLNHRFVAHGGLDFSAAPAAC